MPGRCGVISSAATWSCIFLTTSANRISAKAKCQSFGFSLSLILLPLVLVGLKTIAARFVPEGSTAYEWFEFIGHPFTAILVACLVAIYGLAMRQGMPKDKVMEICGHALQPAGIILLVIGAGGVFKQVLVDSGVGPALGRSVNRHGPADCHHLLRAGSCSAHHSGFCHRCLFNGGGIGNAGH